MISSQRLILMFVLINVLIGISIGIYKEPDIFSWEKQQEETGILTDVTTEFNEENTQYGGIPTTDTSGEGKTIGNPIKMGSLIWRIIWYSMNPISITPQMFEETPEKIVAELILYFRFIGSVLIIIEIYLLLKNKKAT